MLEAIVLVIVTWLTASVGVHLGVSCNVDQQCTTENSICDANMKICVCKPSHPLKLYNSLCVEASRLGERCELSLSCGFTDEHSVCHLHRGCICKPGYRELRIGPNDRGRCVYKDKRTHPYPYVQDSDEDSASHEDDDDDDDDRGKFNDITTPVIVGLVLGSLIVCGWSFAICRLYLKRMERRQKQIRRQHLHRLSRFSSTYEAASTSTPPSMMSTQDALLDLPREHPTESFDQREDEDYLASTPVPPIRQSSMASSELPSTPLISPDEEPLPAYVTAPKKETESSEEPPSYDEVMKQSRV